ncbi:sigma-54 dependent transcriptional regulator [Ralstonia insidiosa]|uniref:Sigma-54-dependent Fis family transcriptional regulator n=1 Tax=Ralstonia insidiosa TaxID=190721 RepID=A0A191ZZV9_9RALS|nr:sigma-54 dependent transcriptional regulator [Ralstonia insidiosa]ANJ73669.1 sigma-54-dependent Fis family transcriptional regulator [Ralstonia insidiosa]KAB0474049.1 sigma-54-dependent Fis family transcriptional regulator [Ralstonia insidiosa]MBY4911997.1 sigma-54 dependent transcriptional regulator [Ralstonia insidiosa]
MSKVAIVREPILVVDDEADLRELLEISLRRMGHDVVLASGLAEAREALSRQRFALVLTDMRLGDGLGIELVRQLSATADRTPVAVITAYGSAENAVEALKAGAFDYIAKPLSLDQLRSLVLNALGRQQRDPDPGNSDLAERTNDLLPGHSAAMQEVRRSLMRLARSMAPVVISGESGSGKERAARAIHALSARASRPFVAVNCGAIPENLMEAEFFGYVKGAFTGADSDRQGFFQAANGGTLMLDEVADLPLTMQVKLLRALQERRVRKIGESREDPVDVRVVCASHQNLARLVAAGRFREDLFYRLNVLELRMPTLRERGEDVPVLAGVLLEQLANRYGDPRPKRLTRPALQQLCAYPFPGNVRELENLLERAYAFAEGESIDVDDLGALGAEIERSPLFHRTREAQAAAQGLQGGHTMAPPPVTGWPDAVYMPAPVPSPIGMPQPMAQPAEPVPASAATEPSLPNIALPIDLPAYLESVERSVILAALDQTGFNRTAAAKLLGLSFRQLRYRMQQLGIRDPRDIEAVGSGLNGDV